ncbi:CDC50/LEM3 family protein, partial [Ascoidea rubescens DSM 1968]
MNFLRRRKNGDSDNDNDNDSINNAIVDKNQKSKKPPNTAFRQQRLRAWQPILTPKTVLPLLFLITLIFAPLGIVMMITANNVQTFQLNYSNCNKLASTNLDSPSVIDSKYYSSNFNDNSNSKTDSTNKPTWVAFNQTADQNNDEDYDRQICRIQFYLSNSINPPIYLFYKLTNFYQNHRKYVESYDLGQLKGKAVSKDDLDSRCDPLSTDEETDKIIYPCGLIANSFFNDSFSNPILLNPSNTNSNSPNITFNFSQAGISWSSDRSLYKKTTYDIENIVPPPNWSKKYPNGYTEDNLPDFSTDEIFQNWMRTAALPNFMKLVGKNTTDSLPDGNYQIDIEMNYPVEIYGGKKYIIITSNSVIGGRNLSLGIAYIVLAALSLLFALIFLLKQIIKPRKIGDHNLL